MSKDIKPGDMIYVVGLLPFKQKDLINRGNKYKVIDVNYYKSLEVTIDVNGKELSLTLHNVELA